MAIEWSVPVLEQHHCFITLTNECRTPTLHLITGEFLGSPHVLRYLHRHRLAKLAPRVVRTYDAAKYIRRMMKHPKLFLLENNIQQQGWTGLEGIFNQLLCQMMFPESTNSCLCSVDSIYTQDLAY